MDPLPSPPPPKENKLSPLYPTVLLKKVQNKLNLTQQSLQYSSMLRSREQPILRPRRTKPIVWCGAIVCMLFSLFIIVLAVAIIITFAVVQPKNPVFDTPAASLGAIYINFPEYLNEDIIFLTNFSNPNRKLSVRFDYLRIELYFSESAIATQVLQPFSLRTGKARVITVRLLSNLVHLPPNLAMELQRQVQGNRVAYNIKGTFRVKVKFGLIHYTYWLHGNCQLEMTSPLNSVMVAHSCTTKR
ncbi:hypothetical protein BUALT_Bualt03G0101900 [Buddleja alternifolia]|uniref:Late embryogenesis abundant protein LEA-2 subgroup domain-containing protein n=1 Tax=Buddleja alternifolia TaxID=168488 RepID=A0AAV6XZX8_9LAMI|nr:hypothetical protein BUALT_Bualt03G0101900 [Buddleja alternifolia]